MALRFKFKILNKAHFKLIFFIKRDDNRKNAAEFSVKICKICQKPLNSPVLSNNKADAKHRQTWRHKTAKSTKTIYLNRDEKDFYQFQKAILRRFDNQSLIIIKRTDDYLDLFYAKFRAQYVLKQICFNFKNICMNILKNKFRIKNATIAKIQRIF